MNDSSLNLAIQGIKVLLSEPNKMPPVGPTVSAWGTVTAEQVAE